MSRSRGFSAGKTTSDLIGQALHRPPQPDTAWYGVVGVTGYSPGFTNSWANAGGSGNPLAEWYLSSNGEVRFRGKITGGTAGSVAFVLPYEVRPQYAETFIVATDGGGNATITVRQNGEVYIEAIN